MGGRWYRGMSADNLKGLALALSSSLFIGASFIIKKKGLKKAASSSSGVRADLAGWRGDFQAADLGGSGLEALERGAAARWTAQGAGSSQELVERALPLPPIALLAWCSDPHPAGGMPAGGSALGVFSWLGRRWAPGLLQDDGVVQRGSRGGGPGPVGGVDLADGWRLLVLFLLSVASWVARR
ncbi:hypothetical protein ACQ4PT_020768 [Festuca glaucescens]